MGRSVRAARLIPLLLPALLCACSEGRPQVAVQVRGLASDVRSLEVSAAIGAEVYGGSSLTVTQRLDRFVLKLRPGAQGALQVRVGGLQGDGCRVSQGEASVTIAPPVDDYEVPVTLAALPQKACQLALLKPENGAGEVRSEPAGLDCGEACAGASAAFAPGTTVTLRARAAPGSYFAGWTGACFGNAPCVAPPIGNQTTRVAARFLRFQVCSEDAVCWQNPLPQGNRLAHLWGAAANDVWAVGGAGTVLRWNGTLFSPYRSGTTRQLTGVAGSGPRDVWAVGEAGTLLHFDGESWTASDSGVDVNLNAVFALDPRTAWAVGDKSTILRWDGARWRQEHRGLDASGLLQVWGSGPRDVWAVGAAGNSDGQILHYDGVDWRLELTLDGRYLLGLWGRAADDLWAVGVTRDRPPRGEVQHWDGRAWQAAPGLPATGPLRAVFGTAAGEVFVSGEDGVVLRYRDGAWSRKSSGTSAPLTALWGSASDDLWASSLAGTLHSWNGAFFTPVSISTITTSNLLSAWQDGAGAAYAVGEGGALLRWDGAWIPQDSGTTSTLARVWGSGPDDIWVVGAGGLIRRSRGGAFAPVDNPSPTSDFLSGLHGLGPDHVWAVGLQGAAYRWDGALLRKINLNTSGDLLAVRVVGPREVWFAGAGVLLHLVDNTVFRLHIGAAVLLDLWASGPSDVWAVGADGVVLRWDGAALTQVPSGTGALLLGVSGSGPGEVFVVGAAGTLLRGGVQGLRPLRSATSSLLRGVSASRDHVYAVGDGGAILHLGR